MKKVLKSVLLLALLLCYNSCVDCKDSNEPQAPTVEPEKEVEVKVTVTTGVASNITISTATISGSVENLGYEGTNVHIGILYTSNDSVPNLLLNNVMFKKSNSNIEGEFSVTLTKLNCAVTYYYRTCVIIEDEVHYGEVSSFTTIDEITPGQEVDLGLSVKWAGWNVGATSPEQYGEYYAWGEIEEKSDYDLDTYKYYNSQTNKFINIGENISGTQYDVATVKWGNGWRIPTKIELEELATKCRFELYTYKGVAGIKLTGPNTNSIFLPFAGYRRGTLLSDASINCLYWSDRGGSFFAYYLAYVDGYFEVREKDLVDCGLSVRPVRDY